jgi:hypothetical protein
VKRLVTAWEQGNLDVAADEGEVDDPLNDACRGPKGRATAAPGRLVVRAAIAPIADLPQQSLDRDTTT